ncbi:HAD family hydrolase [Allosphingosinicella deserti]|uniref:Hydrolase Cof n=1 Tax=Allosphingosinicella deserti TaxID=2116704 RepID=A0A2P7QK65_9SPHN|nr:HAD family hydrolase [Sphingomonas deserti]PSJ38341.1 hydrolase Cof [Sphingomonas deserti]
MSLPIRLVVSDVDGTLVRSDKTLSDAVVAAAARLRAAGVHFSLISARPPSGIVWIAERLGLRGQIGAFNGGTILEPDGRVLSAARLEPQVAAQSLETLTGAKVDIWLFADGNWYALDANNRRVPREKLSSNVDPVIVPDLRSLTANVDKIVGVSDDHALLARLEDDLCGTSAGQATVARSQPYFLDITAPAANKGDGVAALAAAAGVTLAEVAVIGDMRNDLPMFARAGFSIAMGQAPEEVRAAADAVTLSNDEDGVAHTIDEILLGRLAEA